MEVDKIVTRKKGFSHKENKCALTWAKKIILLRENGNKCKECGNGNIFVLDFHHICGEKDRNVALIIGNGSLDDARMEVKKCIVLCRNCHQQKHSKDGWGKNKKAIFLELIGINSCQECGFVGKNNACYDFHHILPNEKLFSFSNYFNKPSSIDPLLIDTKEKVLLEAKKCKVLCRNCHSLIHIRSERFERLKAYIFHKVKNYIGKKKIDGDLIKKLHDSGMTSPEIARKLNLGKTTVWGFLKRNNYLKYKGEPGLVTYWRKYYEQNNIRRKPKRSNTFSI